MLYFPSEEYDLNKQKKLGTNFWNSEFNNFDNYHQYSEKKY